MQIATVTRAAGSRGQTGSDHRARLIDGMARAIADKGLLATTITDIVREARVSKRTFYEHFGDREACFLACYARGSEATLRAVSTAASGGGPWQLRVRSATRAYLTTLADNAPVARILLVDVHAAGPRAGRVRRQVLERFAHLLCELVAAGREDYPELRPLTPAMATALVGGINELVLTTVEGGRIGQLGELEETVVDLVESVLRPHGQV